MKCSRVMCLVRGDGSDKEAIDTAVSLLSGNNRSLQLVYVIVVDRRFALDAPDPTQYRKGERVLLDAEFATGMRGGVQSSMLQSRSIGPVLVREALDYAAEAIVASVKIMSTLNTRAIDSDAEYLMANAPCAVVLVREATTDFETASEQLNGNIRIRANGAD